MIERTNHKQFDLVAALAEVLTLYEHSKTAEQRTINTVIGTLAVDGWAVTLGTARRGLGGAATSSLYQM